MFFKFFFYLQSFFTRYIFVSNIKTRSPEPAAKFNILPNAFVLLYILIISSFMSLNPQSLSSNYFPLFLFFLSLVFILTIQFTPLKQQWSAIFSPYTLTFPFNIIIASLTMKKKKNNKCSCFSQLIPTRNKQWDILIQDDRSKSRKYQNPVNHWIRMLKW